MRSAAHRRDSEVPPEPPSRDQLVAAALADAATWAGRRNALIARLEAEPGNDRLVNELIIACIRTAENTAALEDCTAGESVVEAVDRAAYARGWADRDAAGRQPSRPRHAARGRHLRLAGSAAVKATAVAAAAATATTMIAAHDSASVHHWSAASPAAVRLHEGPADSAVPVPSWSPSARPSADVKAASPAPAVTVAPVPSSSPPAPAPASSSPPAPAPPAPLVLLSVRELDLSGTSGTFTITALDTVDWSVSTDIPGASAVALGGGRQGVLSPSQEPVTITVTVPQGESGSVYIRWGDRGIATVWVTAGAPAVALP